MSCKNFYLVRYTDSLGSEITTMSNDGTTLRMTLRGVEFSGQDFDAMEHSDQATPEQLRRFGLNHNMLSNCQIECEIPVVVVESEGSDEAKLYVELELEVANAPGLFDKEVLRLTLRTRANEYLGSGKSGWFEDELLEIQSKLPEGCYIRACFNCLYSDYSPYGHGCFGCMMCFRNLKSEYLAVKSKADFWSIHDRYDRPVQETYICSEFERRVAGTGYRG